MKNAIAALILAATPLAAAADVGKEDLRKLLQAGLPEESILAYIRANAPAATLSSDEVIELKAAGASDAILKEMIASTAVPIIVLNPPVRVVSETPAARHFWPTETTYPLVSVSPPPRLVFSYDVWAGSTSPATCGRSWRSGCEPVQFNNPCRTYRSSSHGAYRSRACWRR